MENTMNKTIYLVTGAAGFLGGTICRQLIGVLRQKSAGKL